jgi:hypothetical protein
VTGETAVLRMTFRGTDTGEFVGRAPTGQSAEEWQGWDPALPAAIPLRLDAESD